MTPRLLLFTLLAAFLLDSCTSGKSAFKKGDYYDAVSLAVNRLRQNPDHKKSKQVLSMSYQMAVDYLESDAQNQIASNANFKWKNAVQNYDRINYLYEQIRTSPGALKVIPNPINKYKELTEVKTKAAEESYEAGIQSMLKNTREDAKKAYYFFTEANALSPAYRESIEMIEQSKFNATLKVVVEPSLQNYYNWNFEPVIFGTNPSIFVKFYTPREAEEQKLAKIDQFVKVSVNGYTEGRPSVTSKEESYVDSVRMKDRIVNNQKIPVYQKITGSMKTYEKVINGRASITLFIRDAVNSADLKNSDVISDTRWVDRWASCGGDQRAIPEGKRKLCGQKEPYMARDYLVVESKKDLDQRLGSTLNSFYQNY